jgi:DNA-binding MarR family transcriptional regulator
MRLISTDLRPPFGLCFRSFNRRLRAQDEPGGVGLTGFSLLGRLFWEGPSTATDLATKERLQRQSLTRTLRAMEERGLIARSTDAADRRRSTIRITDSGLQLLRQSVRNRESWLAKAMTSTLSATERELLRLAVSLMERLA